MEPWSKQLAPGGTGSPNEILALARTLAPSLTLLHEDEVVRRGVAIPTT